MKKLALAGIAAMAATGLVLVSSPAFAASAQSRTLPAGSSLYFVDCETNTGQLAVMPNVTSSPEATITAVGTGLGSASVCAYGAAYDPTSGLAYWTGPNDQNGIAVYSIDLTTGVSTLVTLDGSDGDPDTDISSNVIAIGTDGTIYIIYYDDFDAKNYFGTVNKSTGAITRIGTLGDGTAFTSNVYGFSYSEGDGKFYATGNGDGGATLLEVNVTTGAYVDKGVNGSNANFWGIAIDSNGVIWSGDNGPSYFSSATIAGWTSASDMQETGELMLNGSSWYSEAPIVKPGTLPDTGTDTNKLGVMALGAALLSASGLALLVIRRRARA